MGVSAVYELLTQNPFITHSLAFAVIDLRFAPLRAPMRRSEGREEEEDTEVVLLYTLTNDRR